MTSQRLFSLQQPESDPIPEKVLPPPVPVAVSSLHFRVRSQPDKSQKLEADRETCNWTRI